jgi:hypothetical protein
VKRPRALDHATQQIAPSSESVSYDSTAWAVTVFAIGLLSCGVAAALWVSDVRLSLLVLSIIALVPVVAIAIGKGGVWIGTKQVFAIIGIALNSFALAAGIPLFVGALLRAILHT